ncbi:MAG: hypothetical protein RL757_1953 [Bacteroidota bacterium]|jgi:bleomycin hydrolase
MKKLIVATLFLLPPSMSALFGQIAAEQKPMTNKKGSQFVFTSVASNEATDVKNQGKSGTCWCYSTNSFLESELLRMGKGKQDLSEMFTVRRAYTAKAERFVRRMGKAQFAEGGEFHDVLYVLKNYGIMPQSAYAGKQKTFAHAEMDAILKNFIETIIKIPNGDRLTDDWKKAYEGILDAYSGAIPEKFEVNGKSMTPKEYAVSIGLNADDYVEITSYTHHPFYEPFVLEIPDNWADAAAYNVTVDELVEVADNAVKKGYTIGWASDVSEKYFSHKNGIAVVPSKDWVDLSEEEQKAIFDKPTTERVISQENRQLAFDDLSTQDDHGMHITGLVKDQTGAEFFTVKNSWGAERNDCGGYLYVSKNYFRYKTISILVHKKAIPEKIAAKIFKKG